MSLDEGRFLEVRYEGLTQEPTQTCARVLDFLGLAPHAAVDEAAAEVHRGRSWQKTLHPADLREAMSTAGFAEALETSGLFYVAQVHVCGVPIASAKVEDSIASLRAQATLAKELGATMLNVHDGVDIWGDADVLRYFCLLYTSPSPRD